jgi:hypothetical protein
MLARLILAKQVVVLYTRVGIHLFYEGKVYLRLAAFGFMNLPEH